MTILTGSEIRRQWERGAIVIDPFDETQLNPNSYNFTLGAEIRVYTDGILDARRRNPTTVIPVNPDEGLVIKPGRLYLAHTREILGGTEFIPTFAARSSVARLGLSIHLSSGLGDVGYWGHWTLQLVPTKAVRIYPGMPIGQMMWWTPVGEITQYDGKYQGAQGARASMCYRNIDRDIARDQFPSLHSRGLTEQRVGAKFLNLVRMAQSSHSATVPEAIVVSVEGFRTALCHGITDTLAEVFADLRATVGANLAEDVARLQRTVASVRMSARARDLLATRLRHVFGDEARFAVRSSAAGEDSVSSSHAGAYQSYLGVQAKDVADAVERVWRSYYSMTAVTGRIRIGDYDPAPRMAVIVQRLVEPDAAGIAMTGLDPDFPDRVVIEAVKGRGERLAAGIAVAPADPALILSPEHRADVCSLVWDASSQLGVRSIDIEWAVAGADLYLLQVRPNTAPKSTAHRDKAAVLRLYDDPIPDDIPLGPVGPSCLHYVTKRARAAQLATHLGIARGGAYMLFLPACAEFATSFATITAELDNALAGRRIVIDASDFVRQVVVHYTQLHSELRRLRAATPVWEPLTVLVREYVTGERGLITRRNGADIYGEACPEGLLAMNRGTGTCTNFTLTDNTVPDEQTVALIGSRDNAGKIGGLTEQMERELGSVAIEWVVDDATLYYVDHTVLSQPDELVTTSTAIVVSPGRCVGRVVSLSDDDVLERLSVAPAVSVGDSVDVGNHHLIADMIARVHDAGPDVIIHARKPYAILAALTDQAVGFVFDTAPLLCHLAIILREQRIPAAIHPAADGQQLMLDDGIIHVITGASL